MVSAAKLLEQSLPPANLLSDASILTDIAKQDLLFQNPRRQEMVPNTSNLSTKLSTVKAVQAAGVRTTKDHACVIVVVTRLA